jgi:predicted dehydrogenase
MSTPEQYNVSVIGAGAGHFEKSHGSELAAIPELNIAVLYDINPGNIKPAVRALAPNARISGVDRQVNPYASDINAVFVVTGDDYHVEPALLAINAGKHVFVEKPIANTREGFEAMREGLATAEQNGRIVTSCHPRRFARPFINTKRLLTDREALAATFGLDPRETDLGSVTAFSLFLDYPPPQRAGSGAHANFNSDHMPHEIDTTTDFFGFSGLRWAICNKNEPFDFDVVAQREDGINLHFAGNRLYDQPGFIEDWQIAFDNGDVLSVNSFTGVISLSREIEPIITKMPLDAAGKPLFKTDYDEHFTALNRHVIRSFIDPETEPPYLTHKDLLMNTVAGLALQEVGQLVSISEDAVVTLL